MIDLPQIQADLVALYDAIDQESPLSEIRIHALRTLTRHNLRTQAFYEATGDWEPQLQERERSQRHEEFQRSHRAELQAMGQQPDAARKVGEYLNAHVPHLDKEVSFRASNPLGALLQQTVEMIADKCLRDREQEAVDLWKADADPFGAIDEIDESEVGIIPVKFVEPSEEQLEKIAEIMGSHEDGDDSVTLDKLVASDESFETHRMRWLKEAAQELDVYVLVLDRRIRIGSHLSGMDVINTLPIMNWVDAETDEKKERLRESLIQKLEEATGESFRK